MNQYDPYDPPQFNLPHKSFATKVAEFAIEYFVFAIFLALALYGLVSIMEDTRDSWMPALDKLGKYL